MTEYKLYAVRIFTRKWAESLAFYRDTLGFTETFADDDLGWAQFDLGGASIGLERCAEGDAEADALVGRFVGVSIAVPDIQATFAALSHKGVVFTGPPEQQPWGGVLAHFEDPDGNVLTLLGTGET